MKDTRSQLETTRASILDALAYTIVESKGTGFSVQEVADRAGVTHRTVYNHFPTRDALSEGLADYAEERLAARNVGTPPDAGITLERLPDVVEGLYGMLANDEVYTRAYVLLIMANRSPPKLWRARMRRFEEAVPKDALAHSEMSAKQITAALRMFASSLGWHTLTEHCGLSSEEAAETARWATRTLIEALEPSPRRMAPSRAPARKKGAKKSAKGGRHGGN